jgi:hypothetical protein
VWQGGGSDFGVNDRLRCVSRRRACLPRRTRTRSPAANTSALSGDPISEAIGRLIDLQIDEAQAQYQVSSARFADARS